jgi:predicted DNA-binding transcriptional regulator YafY
MPISQSDVAGDPERIVCLSGHQTWEHTADRFWCFGCSRIHDVYPVFEELVDTGTGDTVPWTEVLAT